MKVPSEQLIATIAGAVRSTPMARRLPTLTAINVWNALDAAGFAVLAPDHIMPPLRDAGPLESEEN